MGNYGGNQEMKYIKMRGLPFHCTEHEITQFFQEVGAQPVRIHRNQGVAFVEFATEADAGRAMTKDRQNIGQRYIELFRVAYSEMAREVGLQPAAGLGAMGRGMHMLGMAGLGGFSPYGGAAAGWPLPAAQPAYGAARGAFGAAMGGGYGGAAMGGAPAPYSPYSLLSFG